MVSAVAVRPNHYEMLGLTPKASADEIARAFVKQIGRPRAFGGIAAVSIAYETLRDPVKRRAYDDSLGLNPEPKPLMTLRGGGPFVGSSPGDFFPPRPAPRADPPPPPPEPAAEPRTASFIAASLREPARPEARHDPPPAPPPARPQPKPDALQGAQELRLGDVEDRPIEWRRPAIVAGALVAGVVLIGAVAGWQAGNEPKEPGLTAALPAPKRAPVTATTPPPAPARDWVDAQPQRSPHAAVARFKRSARTPKPVASADRLSEVAQFVATPPEATATEQAVATPAAVETSAAMPLPKAVVARTLQRIGYACGQVTSTSAVEETAGAYKVTCTSGHSYQATPVRGRYHFRRVSNR